MFLDPGRHLMGNCLNSFEVHRLCICSFDDALLKTWKSRRKAKLSQCEKVGSRLEASINIHPSTQELAFAVGGKGLDATLWSLETKAKLWQAKNTRPDALGLQTPTWVTQLLFLGGNGNRLLVGTGGQLFWTLSRASVWSLSMSDKPSVWLEYYVPCSCWLYCETCYGW
jgi:hypothetical protein